jgi:hypothetical protein
MIRLSARSLKCTLVLNVTELAAQADPVGARVVCVHPAALPRAAPCACHGCWPVKG